MPAFRASVLLIRLRDRERSRRNEWFRAGYQADDRASNGGLLELHARRRLVRGDARRGAISCSVALPMAPCALRQGMARIIEVSGEAIPPSSLALLRAGAALGMTLLSAPLAAQNTATLVSASSTTRFPSPARSCAADAWRTDVRFRHRRIAPNGWSSRRLVTDSDRAGTISITPRRQSDTTVVSRSRPKRPRWRASSSRPPAPSDESGLTAARGSRRRGRGCEKTAMTPGDIAMMLNETPASRADDVAVVGARACRAGLRGRTRCCSPRVPLYGGQAGGLGLLQIPPVVLRAPS